MENEWESWGTEDTQEDLPEVVKFIFTNNSDGLDKHLKRSNKPDEVNTTYKGETALVWAVRVGAEDCFKVLKEKGASETITSKEGEYPITIAVRLGRVAILEEFLLGRDFIRNEEDGSSWIISTILEDDNVELLDWVCKKYPIILTNTILHGSYGECTFLKAIRCDAFDCVRYLLSKPPRVATIMKEYTCKVYDFDEKQCPIKSLISCLQADLVKVVLQLPRAQKGTNRRYNRGISLLHNTAAIETFDSKENNRKMRIIDLLLTTTTTINAKDDMGNTALHVATDIATAIKLTKAGWSLQMTNNEGKLPEDTTYGEVHKWMEHNRKKLQEL